LLHAASGLDALRHFSLHVSGAEHRRPVKPGTHSHAPYCDEHLPLLPQNCPSSPQNVLAHSLFGFAPKPPAPHVQSGLSTLQPPYLLHVLYGKQ
jgi:hypothetical protein